ncbi:MAG: type II toxin-antitoxin system RelE/ParE family toxin [Stagnimonas sp.]|nr:type II toxin-antitoxin system RelE/ParE family toxin [Stagnimonas sp.]
MLLVRTSPAEADLDALAAYYGALNPSAALRLLDAIAAAESQLQSFPEMGRLGRRDGIREWVIVSTPFLIVYRIRDNTLRILRVLHHAQQWPPATP